MTKSNIIGPISLDDWYLMRMLRVHIKSMYHTNKVKYKDDIILYRNAYRAKLEEFTNG